MRRGARGQILPVVGDECLDVSMDVWMDSAHADREEPVHVPTSPLISTHIGFGTESHLFWLTLSRPGM